MILIHIMDVKIKFNVVDEIIEQLITLSIAYLMPINKIRKKRTSTGHSRSGHQQDRQDAKRQDLQR